MIVLDLQGVGMFSSKQYRDKATEYAELGKTANGANEAQEFKQLENSFTVLADNEKWLHDNHQKTVRRSSAAMPAGESFAEQEEHVLRCLGAALILQWSTLPTKLQRELFDSASSMGEVEVTHELRGQIARFLHKHKDDFPSHQI
jgi:hypothetical protein